VLRRLRIENLVLIREADLELGAGLNAITGETGAGKTILAAAIGLLLGTRGDAGAIGAAGAEAYVEAEFDLPDDDALGSLAELRPEGEDVLVPRGGSSPTGGRARTRGGAARRGKTWRRPPRR
jgi:DNA repair protein RecN (Recombination protein N)